MDFFTLFFNPCRVCFAAHRGSFNPYRVWLGLGLAVFLGAQFNPKRTHCGGRVALGAFDDRTFIDVMNKINVVIVNPPFLLTFLGSVGFTALAGAFFLKPGARPVLIWIGIGLALNIVSLAITSVINVPLNDKLATAAGSTSTADLASLRAQFESSWLRWNMIRALANTAATGVLGWTLAMPVRG